MSSLIKIKAYSSPSSSANNQPIASLSLSKQIKELKQKITQLFPKTPQHPYQDYQKSPKNYETSRNKSVGYNSNQHLHNIQDHNHKNQASDRLINHKATTKINTQRNLHYSKYGKKGSYLPKISSRSNCSLRLKNKSTVEINPAYGQLKEQACPICKLDKKMQTEINQGDRCHQKSFNYLDQQRLKQKMPHKIEKIKENPCSILRLNFDQKPRENQSCSQQKCGIKKQPKQLSLQQMFNQLNFQSELMKLENQNKRQGVRNDIVSVKPIKFSQKSTIIKQRLHDLKDRNQVKVRRKKTNRSHLLYFQSPFAQKSSQFKNSLQNTKQIDQSEMQKFHRSKSLKKPTIQIRGWTLSNLDHDDIQREQQSNTLLIMNKVQKQQSSERQKQIKCMNAQTPKKVEATIKKSTEVKQPQESQSQKQFQQMPIKMDTRIRLLEKSMLS